MRYVTWSQAENKSSVYSSSRSTTVTYNFIKNKVRISRKYPGIFEGANTWIWGINKKEQTSDISFFIKKKDFKKIENNEIDYRKDIFGGKLNELESIPFFGLRHLNVKANKIALLSDIWKYNYSWWIFIVFLASPQLIKSLAEKSGFHIIETDDKLESSKFIGYVYWVLLAINIINFIL